LLPKNIANETFLLQKSGAVRSVDWITTTNKIQQDAQ
jgi:hypothetical protein